MSWKVEARGVGFEGDGTLLDVYAAVIFPLRADVADAIHEQEPVYRVVAPHPECALCAEGTCVQCLDVEDRSICRHGRWVDA